MCRRQEAKYCLAPGSFIFIRSIKAYIYQDSKQLPLLTTSTLFSPSLRCTRAKRRGEAAFNAIHTWRHNSIKRSCFVKDAGMDMITLAVARSLFVLPAMFSPWPSRPSTRRPDTGSTRKHFFFLFFFSFFFGSNLPFAKGEEALCWNSCHSNHLCNNICYQAF